MSKPTPEQIAKLPKWAQEHVASLERQRDEANKMLADFTDSQTESPFFYEEFRSRDPDIGSRFPVRYVQTHKMHISHGGVDVEVVLPRGVQGRYGIEIWFSAKPGMQAAIIPTCSNGITISACKKVEGLE